MNVLTLGEKIKRRRIELGLTLKEVALTKVTPGQISLVESGKSNPSIDLLNYLSEKLDISIDYLMESEYTQVNKIATYYSYMIKASLVFKDFTLAEEYLEKFRVLTEKYSFRNQQLRYLYFKGVIYFFKDEHEKAIDLLIKSSFSDNIFNYQEAIEIYVLVGYIFLHNKSYRSALTYFLSLEIIAQRIEVDKSVMSSLYLMIAECYMGLNKYDLTIKYLKSSYEYYNSYLYSSEDIKKYMEQAKRAEEHEDEEKAYTFARLIYEISNNFDELRLKNLSLGKLAQYTKENGFLEESMNIYRVIFAKKLEKKSENLTQSLCNLIDINIKNDNVTLAAKLLSLLEDKYFEKTNYDKLRIHELLADVDYKLGNYSQAENNLILAHTISVNRNFKEKEIELARKMAEFYLSIQDEAQAEKYLENYMSENTNSFFSHEEG